MDNTNHVNSPSELTIAYQRRVSYLRISVTDRCDLRCVYHVGEHEVPAA